MPHRFIRQLMAKLADRNGEFRGWRLFVLLTCLGAAISVAMLLQHKKLGGSIIIAFVPAGLFAAVGIFFWLGEAAGFALTARHLRTSAETGFWRRPRSAPGGRVVGALGLVVIPALLILVAPMIVREYRSWWWQPVQVEVLNISHHWVYDRYEIELKVRYDHQGQPNVAKVAPPDFANLGVKSEAKLAVTLAMYAPGSHHTFYVDPRNPKDISPMRGPRLGTIILTISGPLFATLLLIASLRALRGKRGMRAVPRQCDALHPQRMAA
jgi:hypothetical protein